MCQSHEFHKDLRPPELDDTHHHDGAQTVTYLRNLFVKIKMVLCPEILKVIPLIPNLINLVVIYELVF